MSILKAPTMVEIELKMKALQEERSRLLLLHGMFAGEKIDLAYEALNDSYRRLEAFKIISNK
jgi:hypothetical protein